jgi:hypothetical protein
MACRVVGLALSTIVAVGSLGPDLAAQCSRWQRIEPSAPTPTQWFTAVAYGGGRFLVTDGQELFTSADGWQWDEVVCTMSPGECMIARRIEAAVWNGSEFIAIGNSGLDRVYRISGDRLEIAGDCPGTWYRALAFNGSSYVAVGDYSTATSPDAGSWEQRWNPEVVCSCVSEIVRLSSVTWAGSRWIAVGDVSCAGVILSGSDSATWHLQLVASADLRSVASDGARTVIVGGASMVSSDGVSWDAITDLPAGMLTVEWTGALFLAVGVGGAIFASEDGVSWDQVGTTNGCVESLAAGGETVIAVGQQTMSRFDPTHGWRDLV